MDTSQLTAEQLEAMSKKTAEILLYRLVRDAHDKVHRLRVKLHYEWCERSRK